MSDSPVFLRLSPEAAAPVESRPDPARLVKGDPVFTSWDVEERGGLYAGIWQATPGAWRVHYDEWEYCRILFGHSVLIGDDGQVVHLRAGDSFLLRPGFSGIWEVIETTRKDYVIHLPPEA